MRLLRLKLDPDQFDAVHHCISRVVGGQYLLDEPAKERFRRMMWDVAEFCGIEILTYIILSNHFHIYILIPQRVELSDQELLRRYRLLHPRPTKYETRTLERIEAELATNGPLAQEFRRRMRRLMNDVSWFMHLLKQRFTTWYNAKHNRYGTLWAGRFKSPLDEIISDVNTAVGAYIDLNCVRAGLQADPKDYRYSGYAEAIAGNPRARKGIMFLTGCSDWESAAAKYRQAIFATGSAERGKGATVAPSKLLEVMNQGGKLPLVELLRCRIRYLSDGVMLGSPEFVARCLKHWTGGKLKNPRRVYLLPIEVADRPLAIPKRMRGPVFG